EQEAQLLRVAAQILLRDVEHRAVHAHAGFPAIQRSCHIARFRSVHRWKLQFARPSACSRSIARTPPASKSPRSDPRSLSPAYAPNGPRSHSFMGAPKPIFGREITW